MTASTNAAGSDGSVLELRQYTLHPGRRDALIDVFDRELVEIQEALGMRVVGQFRDLDDPDRFVWMRGFRDMESRAEALTAFYGGPVWKAHRDEANATMVDWSDVLLLRPAAPGSGFALAGSARPPAGTGEPPSSIVTATICLLEAPVDEGFLRCFEDRMRPALAEAAAPPLAWLASETGENTYPALPVRTGEHAFVWFSSFADAGRQREHAEHLARSRSWNEAALPALSARLARPLEILRLQPTARSLLR
jgi:hypothetical protein